MTALRLGIGKCRELLSPHVGVAGGWALPCGAPAPEHYHQHTRLGERYDCGHEAYCELHGSSARARAEAEHRTRSCWHTLAPAHLSREQVTAAGVMALSSEHCYVAVRAQDGGRWTAGLGIGGHFEDLVGSWSSPEAAELAAVWAWHRRLEARLTTIRDARGGTLEWGVTIQALQRPLVLRVSGSGNLWARSGAARPSSVDLEHPPEVGLNTDERRAIRRIAAGTAGRSDQLLLAALLVRAGEEGSQVPPEIATAQLCTSGR